MRHGRLHHDAVATTRSRPYRFRIVSGILGSLLFLGMIDLARSQSLVKGQLTTHDWVKETVKTSFGGEAKQLAPFRKLQASREKKTDNRAKTFLTGQFKDRLLDGMLTFVQGNRPDAESIFEFENDAYRCGPSEQAGSVFDPSSYTCSTTCELTNGAPSTPIGEFHNEIVNDLLPTLHAVRSLKVAMTGRDESGELAEAPIGGIAFVFNLLQTEENPACLLEKSDALRIISLLFQALEQIVKLLRKVNVPQIKAIAKILTTPIKRINDIIKQTKDFLGQACELTTLLHIATLFTIRTVTSALTDLDQFTALMVPPLIEGTCVSDNTFTLAEELASTLDERGEDPANPGARRAKRHLLEDTVRARAPSSLPMTGNLTVHDRRHFAAALTPHAQDLPIRRALMYSDWEQRSSSVAEAGDGFDVDAEGNRKLALKEPLTQLTTEIISGTLAVMDVFLGNVATLDDIFRTFANIWVDVAEALENFHDAVESLFDFLDPFLGFFDILFKIADIFEFLTCPSFLGFVCFIEDLIAEAIDIVFSPIEEFFEQLIEDLLKIIGLPVINFDFGFDFFNFEIPGLEVIERINAAAVRLVQDVVEVFIDDPLPALYELNPAETSGLDVMYAGSRVDTTVGIEDCADTYGEKRLPMLFHGIQRSAWCPRGSDFTAASLFPCGGLGDVDLVTGDDCVVSSNSKVPLVCVNDNYPPAFLNDDGSVNFPTFLPPRSDFILQAHYACARESTVFELGLLPAEVLATQGSGLLSCPLGRYAVDFAEIGAPCLDQPFLDDTSGETGYTNNDACRDIDENLAPADSNEYISELASYEELLSAQVAAHAACGGDHLCLVDVWISPSIITDQLASLVPPELEDSVDDMVEQHLNLYDWGTSSPTYSALESTFNLDGQAPESDTAPLISGIDPDTAGTTSTVGGIFDEDAFDAVALTEINCGEGSYIERIVWRQLSFRRFNGRGREDVAEIEFSCYGDREFPDDVTYTGLHPMRIGREGGFTERGVTDIDCRGERGGIKFVSLHHDRVAGDNDDWGWIWHCMDGSFDSSEGVVINQTPVLQETSARCGSELPIQSLEHYWQRNQVNRRFALASREFDFRESIVVRVTCPEDGSPLQRARDVSLVGFPEDTNVGRYVQRRDTTLAGYEPDVPECERIAIENAANCNALPLEEAAATCELPEECDSAGVRYYCPVPGIDIDLPKPERVASAFGDDNLKDAVVECPDGMIYAPLEVTQGVPPFGGVNGRDDFIIAGCDGTTSSCVYPSPEGESARIVFQCLCGEGFRPLTNEEGGCDFCPLGTNRTFVDPGDGSGPALADSCLSCQPGFYGDVESDESPVPTCHPCPKNTYSDKIGGVGEDICTPCEAGNFTVADGGTTSIEECVECGVNFECPLGGERTACPVGFWTNGLTQSASCVSCPPGTFGDTDSSCTPCPPGTFTTEHGQTECTPCPVGTYGRDSGADTCEVCPQGTYQDQEGASVCQECDAAKPYTGSVQTTSAAGCWDEDFRSAIDMVVGGTATVEVGGNDTAAGFVVEDPQVVLDLLEAGLLAWADDWAAAVLPGDKVAIDPASTTAAQGELDGQFVLSFKADAENVLVTEAKKLQHMVAYPEVLTDMTTSVAQFVRDDADTDLIISPEPVEESFEASVVASSDQILPPELIDFENPELVDLTCSGLLARFLPNDANAIVEVGDGFCNGGVWNTPQCNFDGGDCCESTCTPVSLAKLASIRATTADDCTSEEIGDGFCDFENNNEVCNFDGGDCCSATCVSGAGGECLEGTFDCRDGSEPPEDTEPRAQSCGSRTMQCLDPAAVEETPAACADIRRARVLRIDGSEHESPSGNEASRRLQELPPAEEDCGSSVVQWGDGVCDARLNNELCNFDGGDCCAQTCVQSPLYPDSCLFFDCVDPDVGDDEPVAVYDGEAPVLKNLPAQDLSVTVFECIAPTTHQVIAADNDPCFDGGLVVPTDEALPGGNNCSFTLTRTWAAEDLSSNSVQAQRTYQVADTEPPVLTGLPAEGLVVETDDPEFSFGNETSVVAVDACSGLEVQVVYTENLVLGQGGDECVRSVSRTWSAEDECGNSVSATRTATVEISVDGCAIGASPSPFVVSAAPTASFAPTVLDTLAPTATPALQTSAPAALDMIAPTSAPAALDTIAPTSVPEAENTTSAPASESETVAPTTPSPAVVEGGDGTPSPTAVEEEEGTASPALVVEPTTPSPTTVAG